MNWPAAVPARNAARNLRDVSVSSCSDIRTAAERSGSLLCCQPVVEERCLIFRDHPWNDRRLSVSHD